jgi:hypothetical protein
VMEKLGLSAWRRLRDETLDLDLLVHKCDRD